MILIEREITHSTNEEIKALAKEKTFSEPVCLYAHHQFNGKGQKDKVWLSQPYKNLTCSLLFTNLNIDVNKQFFLSIYISLAIIHVLEEQDLKNLYVKWPNDILAANGKKLCGILIENTLTGAMINQSVIGIGLNINQKSFDGLPNATSVYLELKREINIKKILNDLVKKLENLSENRVLNVKLNSYYDKLYRYNQNVAFVNSDKKVFQGKIESVTDNGLLQIRHQQDQKLESYDFKTIKFLDQS